MAINNPPAYMGFVGFVRLKKNTASAISQHSNPIIVRATSADLRLSQEITKPDVIDSRYDRTVYQLGPKIVDGSLSFPALYDTPSGRTNVFEILYRYAATRTSTGLLNPLDIDVKYAATDAGSNEAEFTYPNCVINSWKFAVNQSDVVTCDIDVVGVNRIAASLSAPPRADWDDACSDGVAGGVSATRVVTWADARLQIFVGGESGDVINGTYARSFEANINNDVERYYTLNKVLAPQAIAPRKRDITGSVSIMGRNPALSNRALNNEINCSENSYITFGFEAEATGYSCQNASFNVKIPNIVFQIEEMALTNDIFETTVNWHAFPSAGTGTCDPLVTSIGNNTFSY